jgi:hypothetical protein
MQADSRRFWRGCVLGCVATLAMIAALLIMWRLWPTAVPQPLPYAITVGIIASVLGAQPLTAGVIILATLAQLAYGAVWAGLLEVSTRRATVTKGVALGLGLWLIMLIFYLPMAAGQAFELAAKPGIWIATLVGHLIYGALTGALLARDQRRFPPLEPAEVV